MQLFVTDLEQVKKLPADFGSLHFPQRTQRAARFRFEADRLRCIGAGALLWYRFGDVEQRLQTRVNGKPYLAQAPAFNLSHSGEYVVLAVGEGEVGTDIEKCEPAHLKLAKRVFTPREQAWMQAAPMERFARLWTLKESVMKATGKGLQLDPGSFEVLSLLSGKSMEIEDVKLYSFTKDYHGYALSVCASQPIKNLQISEISASDILKKV